MTDLCQSVMPGCILLHAGDAHVAVATSAACDLSELLPILDLGERARFEAFRTPGAAVDFAVAHGMKRKLLAAVLKNASPAALRFRTSPLGKPALRDAALPFSISHSRGYVAIAWTGIGGPECGVDIEALTPRASLDVVIAAAMTQDERSAIARARCASVDFYKRWTMKEAYVKWLGAGLSMPFTSVCTVNDMRDEGNGSLLRDAAIGSLLTRHYALAVALDGTYAIPVVRQENSHFSR